MEFNWNSYLLITCTMNQYQTKCGEMNNVGYSKMIETESQRQPNRLVILLQRMRYQLLKQNDTIEKLKIEVREI